MSAPRISVAGDNPFVRELLKAGHIRCSPSEAELVFEPMQPLLPQQIAATYARPLAQLHGKGTDLCFAICRLDQDTWAVESDHEVAATVAELLVQDMGFTLIKMPMHRAIEAQRLGEVAELLREAAYSLRSDSAYSCVPTVEQAQRILQNLALPKDS